MAQFRVEFVLDQASGMYLAELYHPQNENEIVVRTEALFPTQAAAVLAVVQLFKDAIAQVPAEKPAKPARRKKPASKKKRARKGRPARKAAKRRKHR